jgi:peptidoglycan hydrolase CwlO-like protein
VVNEENENNLDDVKNDLKENKKTNDTIMKNTTELKEEMKKIKHNIEKEMETIKRDHHKDVENIHNSFDKNNEFYTTLKKDLQHLSKQFYNSETDVENEFTRITKLIKDKTHE